ncbi:MAG: MarR family transcriptional regulator [Candidatus Delongbacteria bacterium]|nr:MarR family transcriptional regulator [Candidatus Delongbacteria bacterium]
MSQKQITTISNIMNAMKLYCQLKDKKIAKSIDITCSELNCLKQYFDIDIISVKDLAEKLNITSGGVTRIVASLEEEGVLRRDMDPNDRRGINVTLTDKGNELIKDLRKKTIDYCKDLFDEINKKDQNTIHDGLSLLYKVWTSKLEKDKERFSGNLSGNDNC